MPLSHADPVIRYCFFFFYYTAAPEIYTLSLHDALPISFNQNLAVPTQDARAVAAEIRFRDVTPGSGLESVEALPDSVAVSLERAVALAVGDYDDDETEDLFVSGHLFRGNQGRFIETTASAGVVLRD